MVQEVITLQAVEREEGAWLLPPAAEGCPSVAGTVHSVYRSTLNILDVRGALHSLGTASSILSPGMAVIDRNTDFTGWADDIKPGKSIVIDSEYLLLSGRIRCDLSAARAVSLDIPRLPAGLPTAMCTELNTILRIYGKPGGAGRPWLLYAEGSGTLETLHEKAFYQEMLGLLSLMRSGEEEVLYDALGAIAGMGIGLTPTADDFITGFLGIMLAARSGSRKWARRHRTRWLAGIAGRTTFLGFEMLKQVLCGRLNRAALEVVTACFSTNKDDLYASARRLIGLGSTSGTDMLAGMAFGLEALHVWKRREEDEH